MIALVLAALLAAPPFQGPPAVGFRRDSTRTWTVAQGAANHRGRDAVVVVGAPQWAIAKFAYGDVDKDLKEEDVDVFVGGARGWERRATVVTTREGRHPAVEGVADDGGRVFHTLSPPLPVGAWPVRFHVRGDASSASQLLTVVAPETDAVIFDIDGTLTTSDAEIIKEIRALLEDRSYVPAIRPGAAAVAERWAALGYLVVYVTARPDNLRGLTRAWLAAKGFPPGPVLLSDRVRDVIPGDAVRTFKRGAFSRLTSGAKLRIAAAYGNATTDIEVYREFKVPAQRLYVVGPNAGALGSVAIDFATHLATLKTLPKATRPAPRIPLWTDG